MPNIRFDKPEVAMLLFFESTADYYRVYTELLPRMTPQMSSSWRVRSWATGDLVTTDHPQVIRMIMEIAEQANVTVRHGDDIPPEGPDDWLTAAFQA